MESSWRSEPTLLLSNTQSFVQKDTGDEATSTQSERSLVERVIKSLKRWESLDENRADITGKENVEDHYQRLESQVDASIASHNLNLLANNDRLGTIPKKGGRLFGLRLISKKDQKPDLKIPKALPSDKRSWPPHIFEFWTALTSISNELNGELTNFKAASLNPNITALCTPNVYGRGGSLLDSGYLKHVIVGKFDTGVTLHIARGHVYQSYGQEWYDCAISMTNGVPLYDYRCSCSNG